MADFTYEQRVNPTGTPRTQKPGPVDNGIGDFGRGLQQAGQVLDREIAEVRREGIEIDLTRAMTALQERAIYLQFDENEGYMNTEGEKALGRDNAVREDLKETAKAIRESLSSEEARAEFDKRAANLQLDVSERIEKHVSTQRKVVRTKAVESLVENSLKAMPKVYADESAREGLIQTAVDAARGIAVSKEAADMAESKIREAAAVSAMTKFIQARDREGAKAYFTKVEEQLGEKRNDLKDALDAMDLDVTSEEQIIQMVENAREGSNRWVNEQKLDLLIETIPPDNVELKAEIKKKAQYYRTLARLEKADTQNRYLDTAKTQFFQGGNRIGSIDNATKTWLIKYHPDGWKEIEAMWRAQVNFWNSQADRNDRKAREPKVPNPQQQDNYLRLMQNLFRDPQYANMTIEEYRRLWGNGELTQDDYERGGQALVQAQQRFQKGLAFTTAEYNSIVDGTYALHPGLREDKEAQTKFEGWLSIYTMANRDATPEKIREMANTIAGNIEKERATWLTRKLRGRTYTEPLYKTKPEDIDEVYDPSPPVQELRRIIKPKVVETLILPNGRVVYKLSNGLVVDTPPEVEDDE